MYWEVKSQDFYPIVSSVVRNELIHGFMSFDEAWIQFKDKQNYWGYVLLSLRLGKIAIPIIDWKRKVKGLIYEPITKTWEIT